uniref:Orotidine 5'-phosphate decarboxylase n=1 Tax=uncultured Spirochaetaceae bacterium TaxID=201186 RepID=A0A650EPB6_9SPIO|nr:orotidine 5'-phosphate decarboxylase [uncultured Spirochaetaceae bacterium]
MKHEMQILQEAARRFGPLCVGLDTDPSYIPQNILKGFRSPAEAVLAYNKAILERVVRDGSACCFKIQAAYYEAMGLQGMDVFAQTVRAVRDAGFVAISDVKRGDIAASAQAYARAHFSGDFETDIITVNPYMGFDTLEPFTQMCVAQKKGVFVLLRTSNPGAADIEQKDLAQGGRVLDCVGAELNRIVEKTQSDFPEQTCSCVGAVVGCTHKDDAEFLRKAYPKIFFLIPGYGAQGGDAEICATLLREAGGVVNSSRGILCAYKKDSSLSEKLASDSLTMEDIAESAARAAVASKKDLARFV